MLEQSVLCIARFIVLLEFMDFFGRTPVYNSHQYINFQSSNLTSTLYDIHMLILPYYVIQWRIWTIYVKAVLPWSLSCDQTWIPVQILVTN